MSEVAVTSHQGLVGKYQPYQEYKDSGVEWLGNVPSHWTVTAVKRFSSFTTGWTPPTGNDACFGGEHLWANISDIGHRVLSTTAKTITDAGVRATRIKKSPKGSLLFSFKLSIGLVSIVGEDMYTNEAIATFLPSETFNISYMYWAAPLFIPQNAEENIYGAKLLNQERIGNASFVLPTPKEQRAIAAFLDYETVRIDRLIAQQQRLIELLKEKRQAVISHAVTKGLNPKAPMKDSGIEWLGQVPEHWTVTKLKYKCSHIVDCPHSTPRYDDGGDFPAIRTADISAGLMNLQNARRVSKDVYNERNIRLVPIWDDIIYSREGERFGIGACIPQNAKVCLAQRVMLFRAKSSSRFIMWALNSTSTYNQAKQDCIGSTAPHVNVETIKNFILAWPPEKERSEISEYIDRVSSRIDIIVDLAINKVNLLQERRTALIFAAVTGKIDLRGWTPPAEEAAT